jgi:murein DD-endopeptidase MepM/ murein hydrolase activator NlpD
MGRANSLPSGGGPGPSPGIARGRLNMAAAAMFLLLFGCGQVPGAHPRAVGVRAVASPSPQYSPNGENQPPPPGVVTYEVVTTRSAKPKKTSVKSPFAICPVRGNGYFANDFGAPRYAGGYHPHQGNDVFAPAGTAIVAPFDGLAVRTPNLLGGNAVKVLGQFGYVYNAHLSAYGKTGPVRTGEIVGYVGNTGDALGGPPHNHFEWHPGGGPAINPFPFLLDVCR